MKYSIEKKNSDSLIVFFTGWGCDANCTAHVETDRDVMTVYDYTDYSGSGAVLDEIMNYGRRDLAAWSFGVKTASEIFDKNLFDKRIAINGTVDLISAEYGIHPAVFRKTADELSEENLRRFYRNMTLGYDCYDFFIARKPSRSFESVKNEIAVLDRKTIRCCYDFYNGALISSGDIIIRPDRQEAFWKNRSSIVPVRIDSPHYPFFRINRWEDIIADDEAGQR